MSLFLAILLLALFILLYSIIIEVFTILFRLTGLTKDKARMQVISMLTNSGFTTTESEIIVSARKRRRLAQATMLFGYSFTVIIVSSIVNVFLRLSLAEVEVLLPTFFAIAFISIGMFCLLRLHPVRARLDRLIEKIGNRIMFGKQSNPVVLIDLYGANAMAEVLLDHLPERLRDVKLSHTGLRETQGIHVLFIKRKNTDTLKVTGETILQSGDILLVFGNYHNIRQTFERGVTAIASTSIRLKK